MPVRPAPTTYSCPVCGWSKTVSPRSDALEPGDYYDQCPDCGCTELQASAAARVFSRLDGVLQQIKRSI